MNTETKQNQLNMVQQGLENKIVKKIERFPATDEIDEDKMNMTFEESCLKARESFIHFIAITSWNTQQRTQAENFIIAFDKLLNKFKELKKL